MVMPFADAPATIRNAMMTRRAASTADAPPSEPAAAEDLDTSDPGPAGPAPRNSVTAAPDFRQAVPQQGSHMTSATPVRRRRVLIAADTYPPDVNGVAHYAHRLAAGLAARGNEVHVVCQSADGPGRVEMLDGVVVYRLRSAPVLVSPGTRVALPVRLDRLVAGLAPDVVHVHSHLVVGRAAISAARRRGVPVVVTGHVAPDELLRSAPLPRAVRARLRAWAWRDLTRVFERADLVTAPVADPRDLPSERIFGPRVEAVSSGVDLARFRPQVEPQAWARNRFGLPDRDTVLFVGRLRDDKRVDELIRALPHVLKVTDAQLAIVGSGRPRGALERLAERLGVEDRVRFLGFVPDRSMPYVYAAANVFAMPRSSGLRHLATLEAMASGLPVVAADTPGLSHLVADAQNGHLYRPGETRALGRHIAELLGDPASLAAMGARSRDMAATRGDQLSLLRFEEIYEEVDR
ncbi:Glycosyltransferase involved in cell wall bisynthesis [Sinosporangium album]|uniref:Glycosyltransferase involved in cell wall bisynthesis n=1 Tax=Sinosporangium album TaxID=504805 RepID=A0A1G7VGJ7_9ACTN|nr:glycosyltransferase [Sinosporangium album]SDG58864.1 Glycosyltransferase involved in cell wall bisynthesis [Sinosporangium album]